MVYGVSLEVQLDPAPFPVLYKAGFLFNPWRACAAKVTVVWSVCLSVCLSVCQFNVSPLERLFVLKLMLRTQRATKVKTIVGICLKLLRCRDPPLPALYG